MLAARRWALLFTLLFVVLAAGATFAAVRQLQALRREAGEQVEVVVAATAIAAHTPISRTDLTTTGLPRRFMRQGLLTDSAAAVGKASAVALQPGDLVLGTMLRLPPEGEALRAYTLTHSNQVVVEPGIRPGDHLDVLAAIHDRDSDRTVLVLSGVEVIRTQSDLRSRSVTLALTLEQAQALMNAEDFGKQVRLLRREA